MIKAKNQDAHRMFMMAAFLLSTVFLVSYVIYHAQFGHVSYGGTGSIRYVYFFILITHILLSVVVIPLVLYAIYYALSNQLEKHKKTVKWTFPVWLYVAVSGVAAYAMLTPYI
jgi:putative membrane protein